MVGRYGDALSPPQKKKPTSCHGITLLGLCQDNWELFEAGNSSVPNSLSAKWHIFSMILTSQAASLLQPWILFLFYFCHPLENADKFWYDKLCI